LFRNFARFGPVPRKFTGLESLQQASIITGFSLTTFAGGRHC